MQNNQNLTEARIAGDIGNLGPYYQIENGAVLKSLMRKWIHTRGKVYEDKVVVWSGWHAVHYDYEKYVDPSSYRDAVSVFFEFANDMPGGIKIITTDYTSYQTSQILRNNTALRRIIPGYSFEANVVM